MNPRVVVAVVGFVLLMRVASGAEVTGSLLFDGQPVSDSFYDLGPSLVFAVSVTTGTQVEGTVDIESDTYVVTDLEADDYYIDVYLDRVPPVEEHGNPGDLQGQTRIELVSSQGTFQKDIDMLFTYRVYAPFAMEDTLVGSGWNCSDYPTFSYPITFGLQDIARATEYVLNVDLGSCSGPSVGSIEERSDLPWFEIPWGTAAEDYQSIWITCTGASGSPLCIGPTYRYADGSRPGLFLRNGEDPGRGIHRTDAHVVPAVAKARGANGTYWFSRITVTNGEPFDQLIDIIYTPRGVDGSADYLTTTEMVPVNERVILWDLVGRMTGSTGTGSVEFRGRNLVISSRTFTFSSSGGSYGQGIPPIQPEHVLSLDGTVSAEMVGVEENVDFRTNLGLCEIWGEPATVRVWISDGEGGPPSHADYRLRPYENIQINRVASVIAGSSELDGGIVTVSVTEGSGRVGAYLSVVDNQTADPTYIIIAGQKPSGS